MISKSLNSENNYQFHERKERTTDAYAAN